MKHVPCPNRSPPYFEVCQGCRDRKVPFFWLECQKTQFQVETKKPTEVGFVATLMLEASDSRINQGISH